MDKQLLFQAKFCEIYYIPEANSVHMELIGTFTMDEYKIMFNKFLDIIVETKATSMIADQRRSKGGSMEMRGWLVMNWMPELKKKVNNPRFKVAGINTEKYGFKKFISVYLEKAVRMATGLDVQPFDNLDSALEWVMKVEPVKTTR